MNLSTYFLPSFLAILLYPTGLAKTVSTDLKVGLLLSSMKEERYEFDKKYFFELSREKNILPYFRSANNNHKLQFHQAKELVALGVDYIILQATDTKKSEQIVSYASDHKVPIISYDRKIESSKVAAYITHDNDQIGHLQVKNLLESRQDIKNVVICAGEKGHSVAEEITSTISKALLTKGISVKTFFHRKWSRIQCQATILKEAQRYPISAILANNSQMADGAVEALVKLGLLDKGIYIAGADGSTSACRNLVKGRQQFDVHKPIRELMATSLDFIQKFHRAAKQRSSRTKELKIPVHGVHQGNMLKVFDLKSCSKTSW